MRFPALESLRGLASLAVMLSHYIIIFPAVYPIRPTVGLPLFILINTPVHIFWAGGESVTLFFILSGFVLSLSSKYGRSLDMEGFIIKRIWRIWIPYIVIIFISVILSNLITKSNIPSTSYWFNSIWSNQSTDTLIHHFFLVALRDEEGQAYVPVVWSLKWEMWASLLLPVILIWSRQKTYIIVLTCMVSIALHWNLGGGGEIFTGLLRYLPMFVIGSWVARNHEELSRKISRFPPGILLFIALLLFPSVWYVKWSSDYVKNIVGDYIVIFSVVLIIILSTSWEKLENFLQNKLLIQLGRMSFSLYLYHTLVLTVIVSLGWRYFSLPLLTVFSFFTSFIVAHFAYMYIERPAIRYGSLILEKYTRTKA